MESLFSFFEFVEEFVWAYLGVPAVFALGIYLSIKSRFFQIHAFPSVIRTFIGFFGQAASTTGVHPLKAFFACIGGCVGVGNIVGICTAVQIGGPGALFWIWLTAILGMIVKYAEVYLGVKYRISDGRGGFCGGPMYFIQRVTSKRWVPLLVCFLLCFYGVEVYQFSVITESLSSNFDINRTFVVISLLLLVIFAGSGGVKRVGAISSAIIPVFFFVYASMGIWVLLDHLNEIPAVLSNVMHTAFNGHAAIGGFIGSTLTVAISQGVRRGCYTGDVGVGYASVIHSESSSTSAEKQASLVIFDIFVDTFLICTTSLMVILTTGVWNQPMEAGLLVQTALSSYFPFMNYFMPAFLFILGYSTIIAYFCVGLRSAEFISPNWGRKIYYCYTALAMISCLFVNSSQAQILMAIAGGVLLVINSWGIFMLRHEISFQLNEEKPIEDLQLAIVME
jgi:AGCS family alanine or glycine:cation symporter